MAQITDNVRSLVAMGNVISNDSPNTTSAIAPNTSYRYTAVSNSDKYPYIWVTFTDWEGGQRFVGKGKGVMMTAASNGSTFMDIRPDNEPRTLKFFAICGEGFDWKQEYGAAWSGGTQWVNGRQVSTMSCDFSEVDARTAQNIVGGCTMTETSPSPGIPNSF